MKRAVLAMLLTLPVVAAAGDMTTYLSDTRDLVKRGQYQEALTRFVWFHEHALEEEPGMYGVRLSFALMYWKELGESYPPARDAMLALRDRQTAAVQAGEAKPGVFHEVVALNRTLEEDERTVELFEKLDAERPEAAKGVWEMAKTPLFAAKRYDLIAKYLGSPVKEFIKVKALHDLNTSMYDDERFKDPHFREFNESNFVEESLRLIEIALETGDTAAALEIQEKAVAVIDDARLRTAIPGQLPALP